MNLAIYTKEFRYNWKLAAPVMLGMLGHTFVGFVDNIMVGQIGTAELAAVSHAGLIRLICKQILGLALDAPNFFQIPNTSLTQLAFSPKDRSWSLECLADTTHLQPVFDPLVVI